TLVRHIRCTDVEVVAKFMIDSEVPLLRVRNSVRIERPVERPTLTVVKSAIDEGWFLSDGRKALTQDECRSKPLIRATKRGREVKSILRNAATPPRVESLVVKDPVPCSNYSLRSWRIGDAESRGEGTVVCVFRMPPAKARCPPLSSGKCEPARQITR